ncbi:MAG TPA: hypothetical protein VFG83_05020 [Kofleriaceae bacterium]|nr:hypothetical protein [Kofleriaceae bacterium]
MTEEPSTPVGFLEMMRPYKGLREEVFADLLVAVRAVSEDIRSAEPLDRNLVSALWGICHFTRAWALAPDSMLRRNQLITAEDVDRLDTWIDGLSYAIAMLLDGADDDIAFEPFDLDE